MSFESILLWRPPGIRIGIRLGRVHWKIIWMVGWALCPSLICGWYWAFCVPMFLSGLVPLCSWIYFNLFCKQGVAIPMSYIYVLRDTDQTMTLHEYAVHCCQPLLFCSMSGTSFLPRSTVSLLLSFTLNQASATTSHSIRPSRKNGQFTYLGFVRGCLIGLILSIRFSVLWLIIIKLSIEVLRSFPSILWQVSSMVPAYHSHSWHLLSLKQYFAWVLQPSAHYAQDTPYQHLLSFSMLCTWLYQTTCSILRETKFSAIDITSDKRSQAFIAISPNSFFIRSSWEVTCKFMFVPSVKLFQYINEHLHFQLADGRLFNFHFPA